MIEVIINKSSKEAYDLTASTVDSAGYDLYSPVSVTIAGGDSMVIDTLINLAFKNVPESYKIYAQVKGRSGLSINNSIEVCNAGVIDQDYRGTIKVKLYNNSNINYKISRGDRIAQIIFVLTPKMLITKSKMSSEDFARKYNSIRGLNGLGSSGK